MDDGLKSLTKTECLAVVLHKKIGQLASQIFQKLMLAFYGLVIPTCSYLAALFAMPYFR
jgi:hypothetical protein